MTTSTGRKRVWLALLLALGTSLAPRNAKAALIVDTGSHALGHNWAFHPPQYFAGQFSISSTYEITRVEGYFGNQYSRSAGRVTVAILAGDGHLPGAVLASQHIDLAPDAPRDWYGSPFSTVVGPGTYWAAFIPSEGIEGSMPGDAPRPLDEYAQGSVVTAGWQDYGADTLDYLDLGVRITATPQIPEPAGLILFGTALTGLALRHRRGTMSAFGGPLRRRGVEARGQAEQRRAILGSELPEVSE